MRTPLQMEAWWLVRALQAGATVRNISSESSVIAPGPHLLRNSIADFCTRFGLTPRQRAIFALLVEGLAPKEIADRLSISNVTIRRHAEDIYRKCAMRSQRETLALFARTVMALDGGEAAAAQQSESQPRQIRPAPADGQAGSSR
jgi:DNA-binding NarL/FixJ family response regulator